MKLLVCGGRDFKDPLVIGALIYDVLGQLHAKYHIDVLIEGGAKGADTMAKLWAQDHKITVMEFPANWRVEGKGAGPHRNNAMLKYGQPDMVIAFPGPDSRGTWHMVEAAKKKGVHTSVYEGDD